MSSRCEILSKLVQQFEILRFLVFKMVASAILDFRNSQMLLAEGAWSAEKHHHAKFNESIMELLQYFYFSRWWLPPSCMAITQYPV